MPGLRTWALRHPHEYALVYGSPVPGYQAPQQTIGPAARAATVFGAILGEAYQAGALRPPEGGPAAPASLRADAAALRESIMPGVPDDVIAAGVTCWAALFGLLSFELFGQFENVVTDRDAFFGYAVRSPRAASRPRRLSRAAPSTPEVPAGTQALLLSSNLCSRYDRCLLPRNLSRYRQGGRAAR